MGRKTRYSEELAQTIHDAIALNGGDESGWVAGGISEWTFYHWIREKPQFSQLIARAREEYRKNAPVRVKKIAQDQLTEALEHGQTIQWTTEKTRRIDHFVPSKNPGEPDRLAWYQIETIEEERLEHRPTPQWAIDRVLPKPIENVNEAIALIERYGLKVVVGDAEVFERYHALVQKDQEGTKGNGSRGITAETANNIRAGILGISPPGEENN